MSAGAGVDAIEVVNVDKYVYVYANEDADVHMTKDASAPFGPD